MSRTLCVGQDPEWWTPESSAARLAMAICRRCTGCPDVDPNPVGVIRRGVAYSDFGAACPNARPAAIRSPTTWAAR